MLQILTSHNQMTSSWPCRYYNVHTSTWQTEKIGFHPCGPHSQAHDVILGVAFCRARRWTLMIPVDPFQHRILCDSISRMTHFKISIPKASKCMTHVSVALYSFILLNEFVHICCTKKNTSLWRHREKFETLGCTTEKETEITQAKRWQRSARHGYLTSGVLLRKALDIQEMLSIYLQRKIKPIWRCQTVSLPLSFTSTAKRDSPSPQEASENPVKVPYSRTCGYHSTGSQRNIWKSHQPQWECWFPSGFFCGLFSIWCFLHI